MKSFQYKICSLFAGAGGIDYAFEDSGCKTVWANENDRDACLTFHLNFPDAILDRRDIRTVPVETIPPFDILTGGFPCQPFSSAGKEEGFQDDRGNLFFEICRVIDAHHPKAILLENVASLVTHDAGNTFRVIRDHLVQRGYYMKYLVADAQEYGFPQRRNRIYIVCFQDKRAFDNFSFPGKSPLTKHIWDLIDKSEKAPEWCYLSPDSELYQIMKRAITDDREIYRISDGKFAAKGGVLSSRDGIAFTLLAGMGNWHDREPVIRDPWGIRKLTPEECFRLQGFPERFSLKGIPVRSAYRQAGNTVCVPVVKQIADCMIRALDSARQVKETTDGLVLVGYVKDRFQLEKTLSAAFYHFPARFMPENMQSIRWAAIFLPSSLTGKEAGIQYIGEITAYQVLPRRQITEIPKNSDTSYCRISVKCWKKVFNAPRIDVPLPVRTITIPQKA